MKEMQKLLSRVRYAVQKYDMIDDGDVVAVGVSGGKDSLSMLCALAEMRSFYPKKYDLVAVAVDMGFDKLASAPPKADYTDIAELCGRLGVPFRVKETEIAKIIFEARKEDNPCSLCANMRRGVLHKESVAAGANKLALGHHFDDAVETLMLNLFFDGRFGSFSPVTELSRREITVIRPMIHVKEKDIKSFAAAAKLPVIESACPADGETERAKMKEYLASFDREHRGLYRRLLGALERTGIDGWKE